VTFILANAPSFLSVAINCEPFFGRKVPGETKATSFRSNGQTEWQIMPDDGRPKIDLLQDPVAN
jgi:hypothetical protein